jgi:hypothetical protein
MNYMDEIYDFKGRLDISSRCGLKIVAKPAANIVIITELSEDNPGTSVTECSANLASQIVRDFNLDPEKTTFIEHYPDRGSKLDHYKETFDIVRFRRDGAGFSDPEWERVGRAAVDEMIR